MSSSTRGQNAEGNLNAIVIRGKVTGTTGQDADKIFSEGILPEVRKTDDFAGTMMMHDPISGDAIYLARWGSKKAREEAEARGSLQQKLRDLTNALGAHNVQNFEVVSES